MHSVAIINSLKQYFFMDRICCKCSIKMGEVPSNFRGDTHGYCDDCLNSEKRNISKFFEGKKK